MIYDLIVIGAGASGLAAAITAHRLGKKVLVFEKEQKAGSKILVSGNGKCNLSATDVSPEKYNDPTFVRPVLSGEDPLAFFKEIGIMTRTAGKRLYPYSESALTVVTKLRAALPQGAIVMRNVDEISYSDGVFTVCGCKSKNVALCTGSAATKGTASYSLAKRFGHTLQPVRPSIVPLLTDTTFIKGLSGIRAKARLYLIQNGFVKAMEDGEILFRDGGVSGIAAMCLSVTVARNPGKYSLSINFLGDDETNAIYFCKSGSADGILHKALAQAVERYAAANHCYLLEALTDFRINDVTCGPMTQAQVAAGGLSTKEFDENLQSKLVRGLYAGGEVLDVDGECGGYNLHWAFASGLRIGRSV